MSLAAFDLEELFSTGWRLLPLPAGEKANPPSGWTEDASIRAAMDHAGNLAVPLAENDLGALDIEAAGMELFAGIDWGDCYTVATQGDGLHVYAPRPWLVSWCGKSSGVVHVYRTVSGELTDSARGGAVHLFEIRLGPGLYVVAEGSSTPRGRYTRRSGSPLSVKPWPEPTRALVKELLRARRKPENGNGAASQATVQLDWTHGTGTTPRARAALASACERIENAPARARHDTIRDESIGIGTLVAGHELTKASSLEALLISARTRGAKTGKVEDSERTARDGFAHGIACGPRKDPPRIPARPADVVAPPASGAETSAPEAVSTPSNGAPPTKPIPPPFPWFAPPELPERSPDEDIVRGWIAPGELGCLAGASGSGKSFLALALAVAVAGDREEFLGLRVQRRGVVLYFCAEGFSGLKERLRAADPEGKASARLRLCPSVPMLLDAKSVRAALDSARKLISEMGGEAPVLIVLDTFAQAVAGAEENDNGSMGEAVRAALSFARELGVAVLLVHHSRKNRQAGESFLRGAGSLLCALDAAWGIEPEPDEGVGKRLLLVTEKQKDRPGDVSWRVTLAPSGRTLYLAGAEPVLQVERELVGSLKRTDRRALRRDAILGVLLDQKHGLPLRSIRERLIGREFSVAGDALRRSLDDLRAAGLVELIGRPGSRNARYLLNGKGEHVARRRLEHDR